MAVPRRQNNGGSALRQLVVALAAALAGGCAPSLATLQPAHVAPKGHVQVTAGMEIGIPTGPIVSTVDTARTLALRANTNMLTSEEIGKLYDAGVNLAASPPSAGYHFALAYSVLDRSEVQVRYAGGGWRLGGRYQFLRREDGPFDLVVGLGATRATTSFPYADLVPYLESRDFTRWTFDLPVLAGTSRSWFRVWGGPKLLYSSFNTRLAVTLPNNPAETGNLQGQALYFGGQGGFALGYRRVFFGVELTAVHIWGRATAASVSMASARTIQIEGWVIYPAFALMGEF